ncbi:MAG: AAA family ATPase [Synergistaceae bacterium]|nr:AAA family ATPase [Synergistaceae bacterium]
MLKRLSIKNVGGIGSAELTFSSSEKYNFNVVTGESGAGKSSVVRALEILSGKRSQASYIRAGEEKASVEAVFTSGRDLVEESAVLAARECPRTGRGSAYIQAKSMPLSSYTEFMAKLLRIQSQFAQLELLDEERQLVMVDASGGRELTLILDKMKQAYQNAVHQEKLLRSLTEKGREIESKYENADKIIQAVKQCKPQRGLESELEEIRKSLSGKISAMTQGRNALDEITGGASGNGIMEQIERACMKLCSSLPEEIKGKAELAANEGISNIQDMLRMARANFSVNELKKLIAEHDSAEQRLGNLRKLKRMIRAEDEEAILKWSAEAEEAILWLQNARAEISEIEARSRTAKREASRYALQLRELRKAEASKLELRVNECLKELGLNDSKLSIRFSERSRLRRDGADRVNFVLVTKKREGRVEKIASGGELSRLLLALQLSLPDEWLPDTIVFDEVEAGLGGMAAVLSGEKLRELSSKCQVILVTHEASIAALGEKHFLIEKHEGEAMIQEIEEESRVSELARMLTGDSSLPEARLHARKLLESRIFC